MEHQKLMEDLLSYKNLTYDGVVVGISRLEAKWFSV